MKQGAKYSKSTYNTPVNRSERLQFIKVLDIESGIENKRKLRQFSVFQVYSAHERERMQGDPVPQEQIMQYLRLMP